jgi:hypothetical protein
MGWAGMGDDLMGRRMVLIFDGDNSQSDKTGRDGEKQAGVFFVDDGSNLWLWVVAWLEAHTCAFVGIGMPLSSSAAVRRHDPGRGLGG